MRHREGKDLSTWMHACAEGLAALEWELIITLVILALGLGMAATFPLTGRSLHLGADTRDFAANLQVARNLAQRRFYHYRVRVVTPTQYAIERGELDARTATWIFPVTERTVNLRGDVAFDDATVGLIAEFNTRGVLITAPAETFSLHDRVRAWTKRVAVNAAGLVTKI